MITAYLKMISKKTFGESVNLAVRNYCVLSTTVAVSLAEGTTASSGWENSGGFVNYLIRAFAPGTQGLRSSSPAWVELHGIALVDDKGTAMWQLDEPMSLKVIIEGFLSGYRE